MVRRVYAEKKDKVNVQAQELYHELRHYLGLKNVTGVRILNRYDVDHISDDVFETACKTVFSEPPVDRCTIGSFDHADDDFVFSVRFLPGQFDQRADSAKQCIRLLSSEKTEPLIRSAVTYVISGILSEEEKEAVIRLCMNPVDQHLDPEEIPDTLETVYEEAPPVPVIEGFCQMSGPDFRALYEKLSLAMTFADFCHIKKYFSEEDRDPTETEIRVLDTYWSDHCRHTTFSTVIENVEFEQGPFTSEIQKTYEQYTDDRKEVYKDKKDKPVCLMDIALMAMKKLKAQGKLCEIEESEEINACSIIIPVDTKNGTEQWLLNFKNETHNHPTEIEPFGGAATCLGGAIRDPLSGRTYVYQAMRITGAADPTLPVDQTLPGKLPQKKLVREAARGYSSYGNQIGLATGYVKEIYHPDYVAKHMEIGAVLGAAKCSDVVRKRPEPGDVIVLLGGRTGRDGMGGATGSSKVHTEKSIDICGAEVQKGNAPTERKIQRLFRNPDVSLMIKRCNDFGAGGVSVAIGELADGVEIMLDHVPKKYAGLSGTETAISESQERMAVVLAAEDVSGFIEKSNEENLEATVVAKVTDDPRLVMIQGGRKIVDISRAFLDTNGASQRTDIFVESPALENSPLLKPKTEDILSVLTDLNVCSQKGLSERFDSSIGAGTVLMPYGGLYQDTEIQTMVAKIPVPDQSTDTVSLMSYGFDPEISSWSPYHGAIYAVTESVAKVVAAGGDYKKIYFTFQEYFKRMTEDPRRWSQPFCALLGAYRAQLSFGLAAIGGKDSMSGTFGQIDVVPTLVSFAVAYAKAGEIMTPELKRQDSVVLWLDAERDEYLLPDFEQLKKIYDMVGIFIQSKDVSAAYAVEKGGAAAALAKMCFGNRVGVSLLSAAKNERFYSPAYGSIIVQVRKEVSDRIVEKCKKEGLPQPDIIAEVIKEPVWKEENRQIGLEELCGVWKKPLSGVYPEFAKEQTQTKDESEICENDVQDSKLSGNIHILSQGKGAPRVFIPVLPGTNCEYDSAVKFREAGGIVSEAVFKNLTDTQISESIEHFAKCVRESQIVMFPGGFSAGDEPDGSAKYFASVFRNEKIMHEIHRLLEERDGLILGICNGFQTLVKLGLLPAGKITGIREDSPTLTYNTIGRHISKMAYIKVINNRSPWLGCTQRDAVYVNPVSHGEGRFAADAQWVQKLSENGQIATVYCSPNGVTDEKSVWNVNGSVQSIEGIISADGRIYGKMAHAERVGKDVAKNIYGRQDMRLFESGVNYFKHL